MNTNYIEELNESQCAAVTYNDGPSLVIAGAGSGKTRVLTYKIAYLLEQENGYNPWNILALTRFERDKFTGCCHAPFVDALTGGRTI